MTELRRATPDDAAVLGRLLWDFNTEFDAETDDADVLAERFGMLLTLDDIVAVLAEDDGGAPVGFALLSLRPAIWYDGPVSQLEELYVVPALRSASLSASRSSTSSSMSTTTRALVRRWRRRTTPQGAAGVAR